MSWQLILIILHIFICFPTAPTEDKESLIPVTPGEEAELMMIDSPIFEFPKCPSNLSDQENEVPLVMIKGRRKGKSSILVSLSFTFAHVPIHSVSSFFLVNLLTSCHKIFL